MGCMNATWLRQALQPWGCWKFYIHKLPTERKKNRVSPSKSTETRNKFVNCSVKMALACARWCQKVRHLSRQSCLEILCTSSWSISRGREYRHQSAQLNSATNLESIIDKYCNNTMYSHGLSQLPPPPSGQPCKPFRVYKTNSEGLGIWSAAPLDSMEPLSCEVHWLDQHTFALSTRMNAIKKNWRFVKGRCRHWATNISRATTWSTSQNDQPLSTSHEKKKKEERSPTCCWTNL